MPRSAQSNAVQRRRASSFRFHGRSFSRTKKASLTGRYWCLYEVLGEEPDLELVGADDVADDEVVGAVVAGVVGALGDVVGQLQDQLVAFEEPRDLDQHVLAAAWRAFEARHLGHVLRHSDA